MKIVYLDHEPIGEVPNLHLLDQLGETCYHYNTMPSQRLERMQGFDIVIVNKVVLDRSIIEQCPDLKLICVAATGVNNIDVEFATSRGIKVKNVAAYSTNTVAQTTFATILTLINRIPYYNRYVHSGEYVNCPVFAHIGPSFHEIWGKRLGIIGLGTIGKRVAEIGKAFGCEVVYYSTSGNNFDQNYNSLSLNELLQTSDIISIHAPLNQATHNLRTHDQLKLMKSSAIIINMGRGGIINEADLVFALNEGIISGAALDVYENEPIKPDNPVFQILDKDKLVLTPHIAWASIEARTRLVDKLADNIKQFLVYGT